jgi:hypothetical protein
MIEQPIAKNPTDRLNPEKPKPFYFTKIKKYFENLLPNSNKPLAK